MNKGENLGKCVTDNAVRKVLFKKNQKTGKISKVIKITHTQKCSHDHDLVALEGKESKENNLLDDDLEEEQNDVEMNMPQAKQDEAGKTKDKEMEVIREHFRRYLKGV